MQARLRQFSPRAKATTLRVAWNMTKGALDSHAEDDPTVETGNPLPLGFLVPRIDLYDLFMRLLDRLLSHPALDQHPVHHVADDVGGEHLA